MKKEFMKLFSNLSVITMLAFAAVIIAFGISAFCFPTALFQVLLYSVIIALSVIGITIISCMICAFVRAYHLKRKEGGSHV